MATYWIMNLNWKDPPFWASIVHGDGGADWLIGQAGDDVTHGGADDDHIYGMEGDDRLFGETGDDLISGGAGNDTFGYVPGDGLDTISDFNTGNSGTLNDGDSANNDFADLSPVYNDIWDLHADFADDNTLNQSNSTAKDGTVDHSGNAQFAVVQWIVFSGQSADSDSFTDENTGVVCFMPGTLILTEQGQRPIKTLRSGDRIVTRDNGVQPLQWLALRKLGRSELLARRRLRPVLIPSDLVGATTALPVSPQHGMLLRPSWPGRDIGARDPSGIAGWRDGAWRPAGDLYSPAVRCPSDHLCRRCPQREFLSWADGIGGPGKGRATRTVGAVSRPSARVGR